MLLHTFENSKCYAYAPDGDRICMRTGLMVQIFSSETDELLPMKHASPGVNFATFSPDGKHVVMPGGVIGEEVCIWSAITGELTRTFKGHTNRIRVVAWSPDGKQIASGSDDQTVRVWSVRTGAVVHTFCHKDEVSNIDFSSDGLHLASFTSWCDNMKIFSLLSGNIIHTIPCFHSYQGTVFSPNGEHFVTKHSHLTIRVWSTQTGERLHTLNAREGGHASSFTYITCMAYSPNGKYIAAGRNDGTGSIWSAETGVLLHTLTLKESTKGVLYSMDFSPDEEHIAFGGCDKTVSIWSVTTGKEVLSFEAHTDVVWKIMYSPNGQQVATWGRDDTLHIWSVCETDRFVTTFLSQAMEDDDLLEASKYLKTLHGQQFRTFHERLWTRLNKHRPHLREVMFKVDRLIEDHILKEQVAHDWSEIASALDQRN